MGYINVFVSKPCRIAVKNRQLTIVGESELSFPIEDLNAVLLETGECNVTVMALRALADAGVVVFVCDERHVPNGVMIPFKTYYRSLKVLNLQINMAKPLKKQLWQAIVRQKIVNQATCMVLCDKAEDAKYLFDLSKEVNSADSRNAEAVAASYYFKKVFGDRFTRERDLFINDALNYGYSLVRGTIARTLSVYGFETSFGLHHCNQLNNFNLADDLIEPFRPVVDGMVYALREKETLDGDVKRLLFSVFTTDVEVDGQKYALSYAVELMVQSLRAVLEGERNSLLLPQIVKTQTHRYE